MHLTRAATVLAILTLLLGILGQWSPGFGEVPWWRVLAGVLVIALAAEWLITRNRALTARVGDSARFYLGREQSLELEFDNRGVRAVALRFLPTLPPAFAATEQATTISLAPLATSMADLKVRALALGRHRFESLPVRVRGPLGLAWWARRLDVSAELPVYPDTLGPRSTTSGNSRGGGNAEARPGGAMELHHLREYRPGDALNAIDWKATARTGKLVTRIFNEDQHLEVMILLDAGRVGRTEIDEINQFGHFVNLAARFAEYCVASDDRVGLVAFTDRPVATMPPGRGIAAVQRMRGILAGLEPAPVESDVLQAALKLRQMLRHRSLVVILTDLYERTATSQLIQASRLLLPQHLPLVVGLISDDVAELAGRPAREWLDPYQSLAARQYQRDVTGNAARLVQLGAHALTARPDELDRKVLARYDLLRAQRRI